MTQIFRDGLAIPASVIALDEGNIITQVSFRETSGEFQYILHFGSQGYFRKLGPGLSDKTETWYRSRLRKRMDTKLSKWATRSARKRE